MKKKFICTVCGYVYEGTEAPKECPICHAPASKFQEVDENEELKFETEHVIGVAKGCDDERRMRRSGNVSGYEPSGRP